AKRRWGPARIAGRVGIPASTCHAILARAGVPRLAYLDRATGRPVRRYEHPNPGDLIHVDIKKLGNIPDGGGWRVVGRAQGNQNRQRTTSARRNCKPVIGYSLRHTALDDHSRLAYTVNHPGFRGDVRCWLQPPVGAGFERSTSIR